jgi:pancreatic triacylglycerol lipase
VLVGLNKTELEEANFRPEVPIKFLIHGFIDTGFSSWVVKMAQTMLTEHDFNVFSVDWGGGSLPLYTQVLFPYCFLISSIN